jgi:hypothetical protein
MQFRLYYDGPLYSSQRDPLGDQIDKRAGHKHDIRRTFHLQLKHLWATHPFLNSSRSGREILGEISNVGDPCPYLWENIAERHQVSDRKFVPLVCQQFSLLCELDILMLRNDKPGGVLKSRDLDNRLKVLFDALRMPQNANELTGADFLDHEHPMFVLLQDDSLITAVAVETDELLSPSNADDSEVRLTITVTLKPYNVNMFNLSFG